MRFGYRNKSARKQTEGVYLHYREISETNFMEIQIKQKIYDCYDTLLLSSFDVL